VVYSVKYPMILGFILAIAGFSLLRRRKRNQEDTGKNQS